MALRTHNMLYIIATPIGNLDDITLRAISVLRSADFILAEDTRVTRILLDKYNIKASVISYHQHSQLQKIEHIKVPIKRLDDLMNLMEELLVDKMRLEQFKNRDVELKGVIEHLGRLVSDIQHQVMQARLVPVDQIFARFPRMVRDLSQNQNKQVELEVSGGEIELDRTVVDKLGEPLVHILRNAVDHGIEKSGMEPRRNFLKNRRQN